MLESALYTLSYLCISILEFKFKRRINNYGFKKIYVFLYQNLNNSIINEQSDLLNNLCISILEFKFSQQFQVTFQFLIYVFLYQNLNVFVGDLEEFITFIYVFLYQNLNVDEIEFEETEDGIYVFLYQNLNEDIKLIDAIEVIHLCISILEFKYLF